MNADNWLKYYFGEEYFSGNFSHLSEIIFENLKFSFEQSKIITIAGTNGKGQTARILEQLILNETKSCALWTSPHLLSVAERFSFGGKPIEDNELINVFEWLKRQLEISKSTLSYYEFLFVCFLKFTQEMKIDYIILEVGLGGRLDATNVLDCQIAAVTSVSRDHQEILGTKFRYILLEKLAISRSLLITALELSYLRQITKKYVQADQLNWIDLFEEGELTNATHFSERNYKIAIKAYRLLGFDKQSTQLNYDLIGRRACREYGAASFHLYPSHNPDGIRKLVQFLAHEQYNYNKCLASFSHRDLKDLECMISTLVHSFGNENVTLCSFDHPKALSSKLINQIGKKAKVNVVQNTQIYFKSISSSKSRTLVTGSNYFIAEFCEYFDKYSAVDE